MNSFNHIIARRHRSGMHRLDKGKLHALLFQLHGEYGLKTVLKEIDVWTELVDEEAEFEDLELSAVPLGDIPSYQADPKTYRNQVLLAGEIS